MNRHAIVIAAKPPVPGKVKTRLSPPLSLDQSAQLYECFLVDTINTVAAIKGVDRFIAFYPDVSTKELSFTIVNSVSGSSQNEFLADFTLITQKGIDLGERLISIFEQLLSSGYDSATIIGSDSPNLPVAFIKRSLSNLKESKADVTLGPCKDGGYYLIGLKTFHSDIFKGISWSTSSVFDETIKKIKKLGLGVSVLPEWYDVDNNEDLNFLKDEIISSPEEVAPKTRDFLCFSDFS